MWVLMAEIATAPEDRSKLQAGKSLVTAEMVLGLEERIDDLKTRTEIPADFVVPGQDRTSALLDQARTVVRRAERLFISARKPTEAGGLGPDESGLNESGPGESGPDESGPDESLVGQYLNRLSDLLWTAARWQEGVHEIGETRSAARIESGNRASRPSLSPRPGSRPQGRISRFPLVVPRVAVPRAVFEPSSDHRASARRDIASSFSRS